MDTTQESTYDTVFASIFRNANGTKPTPENLRMKATLEAISSVIDSQGGKRIPTAYFAILLTSLTDGRIKDDDAKAASFALLANVITHVPAGVLKSRQSEVCSSLVKLFQDNFSTTSKSLLKSMILCMAHIVKIQKDPMVVGQPEILQIFQHLINLTIDARPKVRHEAQAQVKLVFAQSVEGARNTLSNTFTSFALKILNKKGKDNQDMLHTLGFLKTCIFLLSPSSITTIFETLFKLISVTSNLFIPTLIMQCMESLFSPPEQQEDDIVFESTKLPASFYSQLIASLYDLQPNVAEAAPTTSFAQLMSKAFIKFHKVDSDMCLKELPKYFKVMMGNFTSDRNDVVNATFQCLKETIIECVDSKGIQQAETAVKSGAERKNKTPVEQIIEILEGGLKYSFKDQWSSIFEIYAILFETVGPASHPLLVNLLKSLGDIHDSDFHATPFSHALKSAISSAIGAMGPQNFLSVLPMSLADGYDPKTSRDWILPMMKTSIRKAPLRYFADYLLPLATNLVTKSNKIINESKIEAKHLQVLYYQIWDLFPSFCVNPPDVVESFKLLAKTLGTSLQNDPQLRRNISLGLTRLIEKNRTISSSTGALVDSDLTQEQAKANVTAIAAFSKNFLPIFFNIYGPCPNEDKQIVLSAIEAYVSITDTGVANSFFKNIVTKLLTATTEKEGEETMETTDKSNDPLTLIELTIPFVKYLTSENLKFLYKVVKPLAKNEKNVTLQKKSYKVIQKLVESQPQWVNNNLKDIEKLIVSTLLCATPVKKIRLRVIKEIVMLLDANLYTQFVPEVLADVIMGTRDSGAKARDIADDTIKIIGSKMAAIDNVKEFFVMVIAGLGGQTPIMISSTLSVLGSMLKDFANRLEDSFINELLTPTINFINSYNREILRGTFDFVRSALSAVSPSIFEPHLGNLVKSIIGLPREEKQHFRVPMSFIFERLLKKFSYEKIIEFVPEDDHKLINHIRKALRRKERKKTQEKKSEDKDNNNNNNDIDDEDILGSSDDEDDEMEQPQKKVQPKMQGRQLGKNKKEDKNFIMDDSEEPLDLMDPKSISKVVTKRPMLKGKSTLPNKGFKVSKQGKFIFNEDGKDDYEEESTDIMEEDTMETETHSNRKEKAKRKRGGDDGSDDESSNKKNNNFANNNNKGGKTHKSQDSKPVNKHTGSDYKSKKGKGDILKSGKVEPYAYVPLNPKLANKRRKNKAVGQFKNIIEAAKKGAQQPKKKQRSKN